MKAIYVEWVDSAASVGWYHPKNYDPAAFTVKSVGFVMQETKKTVVISTSLAYNDKYADPLTIPKVAITKRRWVKL